MKVVSNMLYSRGERLLTEGISRLPLTLIYMGYFDNLFYMGGQKKPPV